MGFGVQFKGNGLASRRQNRNIYCDSYEPEKRNLRKRHTRRARMRVFRKIECSGFQGTRVYTAQKNRRAGSPGAAVLSIYRSTGLLSRRRSCRWRRRLFGMLLLGRVLLVHFSLCRGCACGRGIGPAERSGFLRQDRPGNQSGNQRHSKQNFHRTHSRDPFHGVLIRPVQPLRYTKLQKHVKI